MRKSIGRKRLGAGGFYARCGKRCLDVAITAPALLALSPFLAAAAALVRLESSGSAWFIQERLGRGGRKFRLYKFRTMTDRPRTSHTEIIGQHQEVTKLGHWLRRFKIDELPQLVNVLKGDMSVVGPRPALPQQLDEYDEVGRRRLLVRPGLTGLAQIHGNIHLSWQDRWQYDARYVEQLSLPLDAGIMWRTLAVILLGEDRFLEQPASDPGAEVTEKSS